MFSRTLNFVPQLNVSELPSNICMQRPQFRLLHFFFHCVFVMGVKLRFSEQTFKVIWLSFALYEFKF